MDDLHDQLVKAYLEYFKANEAWERKKSVRKYYAVQKCTKNIKKISHQRNLEIREEYYKFKKEQKNK